MITRGSLIGFLVTLIAGVGAYTVTVQTRPATPTAASVTSATETLLIWLGASETQKAELRGHDPTFAADLNQLKTELQNKKQEFAALLEKADVSDDAVRSQLEAVLNNSNAIERRVANYLLSVRDHLTPEQRRKLFGLCADEVRQGGGHQWGRVRREMSSSQPHGGGGGYQWGRTRRQASETQPHDGGGPGQGRHGDGPGSGHGR
jgi:Spy/CpxP family protein refolding chaperone